MFDKPLIKMMMPKDIQYSDSTLLPDIKDENIKDDSIKHKSVRDESNPKLTIFAEMCEDGLYTCLVAEDGSVQIDWASPAFQEIVGCSLQSVNQAGGLLQFIHEADQAQAAQQLQSALAGQGTKCILHIRQSDNLLSKVSHHLRLDQSAPTAESRRLYGVIRLVDQSVSNPHAANTPAITGLSAIAATGTMNSNQAQEERLAALIKAIPDAITITDAVGVCVEYYPGRPESLYIAQDHMLGANLSHYFAPDIVSTVNVAVHSSLENAKAERVEFPVELLGETHWYESSISPFGDGQLLSLSRNITERKHAEEALRLSEERNRALLQAIPDMMFLIDKDGYYLDLHANTPEDLLETGTEHIGKHTRDLVPPELAKRFLAANERVLTNGLMEIVEYGLEFEEGTRIFEARIVPCGNDKVLSIVRNITARKQSEAALRASEEQNRALLQAIPDLMLLLRRNGDYLAIHTASSIDLYAPRDEMLRRNVSDYVSAEEFTHFEQIIDYVMETEQMVIQEYSHLFGDELRYFESRIVPCGNEKVLSITRNITERKQIERQLQIQNALLQAQLDASPDGILAIDNNRNWIGGNQRFIDLWQLPDDIVEQRSSRVTLQYVAQMVEDPEKFLGEIEKVYREQRGELFDEVAMKDGRIFERRSRPILDIEQNVLGRIWFYSDVTQERKSAALLRSAEADYRALFENLPIGVYRSSPEGRHLRANPALVRLNGYRSEAEHLESVHNNVREWYVDPVRRDEFKERLHRDGEVRQFESEVYRHKTRERIWISEDALLVRDKTGKALFYEGTVQNISERKQAEEAIRRLNEQLQNASRLKDEFLKNISHEFRTPLTIILTLSETLSNGRFGLVSEQQKSSLQRIQKQSHNLLEMVNNLLDMATLLSGTIELQRRPVLVQDLCSHVLYSVQEAVNQKQISISSIIDPQVKSIEADERRLGQVVQILVGNAIKFTPEGGEIGIEVQGFPETQQAQISVWDTGIGLQPEDTQKLFQPFIQLDTTLSRRYEGAGLGLALAAHLTELHKGTIIVESHPGQGARFTVILPWIPKDKVSVM